MKSNQLPEISALHDHASLGLATQESRPENEPAMTVCRWELCQEIFHGQTIGWKVVRLN